MGKINMEAELIKEEGLVLSCYKDSKGNWTAGVGHLLKTDIGNISLKLAGEWLAEDIKIATEDCLKVVPYFSEMNEERQYAMISMMFNLGRTKFTAFKKMLSALSEKDFVKASQEMLDSKWHSDVKKRAEKLAKIIEKGVI